ncbi:MAG: tRNA (adenosine(37)-N6)-threonylcarbamoyltransferase complex transferase subunit TsaD [Pararhodobacter sp.]
MPEGDLILGIETSCDDTSVALVARDGTVIACETLTQFTIHEAFGGVFPDLASRAHLTAILPAVARVMHVIGDDRARLAAIAVTRGPGLIGSLLVGVNAAQALGLAWDKPVIGVNHLRGHLRSPDLDTQRLVFPALMLLASGGHTLLAHLPGPAQITLLGQTRDDSMGECYDKVARMLGYPMPGGPAIDRMARLGQPRFDLPRPMLKEGFAFSFSGLKSSVARLIERQPALAETDAGRADVAASFVQACLEIAETKLDRALRAHPSASVVVVGGVAASAQLRARMQALAGRHGITACLPPLTWATDNAAMIALAGWDYLAQGINPGLRADPALGLNDW